MHVQSNRTRTRVHLYCTHSISELDGHCLEVCLCACAVMLLLTSMFTGMFLNFCMGMFIDMIVVHAHLLSLFMGVLI